MTSRHHENKLLYLEGLRGLAAYGVFYIHFIGSFCSFCQAIPTFGQKFNVYVALFFILSGRVLCASVLRKALTSAHPSAAHFSQLGKSILKRPFRLALPLTAVTILHSMIGQDKGPFSLLRLIFSPVYFMVFNSDFHNPIPGVSWTMPHELSGSMGVYGLCMVILSVESTRSRTTILLSAFAFSIFSHSWSSHFILGLIFAFAAQENWFAALKMKSRRVLLFKTLLAMLTFFLFFESPISIGGHVRKFLTSLQYNGDGGLGVAEFVFWQENVAIMWIAAVIMLLVETTEFLQRILSSKFPLYLAKISFMMYLTHEMLYAANQIKKYWMSFLGHNNTPAKLFYILIANICLFITSDFFTMTIDQPCLDLTNFIAKTLVSNTWTFHQILASVPSWPQWILKYLLQLVKTIGRTYYGYLFYSDLEQAQITIDGEVRQELIFNGSIDKFQ